MRVLLLTEGTYPLTRGGVSTWCDHLVTGLRDIEFDVLALGATGDERPVWEHPANLRSVRVHGMWGELPSAARRRRARRYRDHVGRELRQLWRGVLGPDTPRSVALVREVLQRLVQLDDEVEIAAALAAEGSSKALSTVWRRTARELGWPPLSVAQAVEVAGIVDRTLALISVRAPRTDIVHATANGPCGLVGVTSQWRGNGRLVLTEHGIYLREQYIALRTSGLDWAVRKAVTSFTRRVSEVVLREAQAVLPVSDFNQLWEREMGVPPERLATIRNGVSAEQYPVLTDEPSEPTISFVGRIDPLKDLETLVRAHAIVQRAVPGTLLRVFGPVPAGNEDYAAGLRSVVAELGTETLVTWEGPVAGSQVAIEAGHVVALSSISEGMPYTLIEALMCGRATVSTDVGGVGECVGSDGQVGLVVPPRQPDAFAAACVLLLRDHERRRQMGARAAVWARERFSLLDFSAAYRGAYEGIATDRRGPRHALAQERVPAGVG
ncbi:GT4 family glycosyltransferase PelF [Cellulosimicrobium cellulans]|uniref:GT4 family glycosyltransferase PelF n=1 Tax=Cellulosimicrobium cellulans TaxID=1710 RepID=UPI0024054F2A|nr:GT4 family glycosyltransferase PelF [Cellulosimicrobium cellulans]MDF9874970.1 glycosyltransferase involved in cell wall biosynthesis [Cellulosimicrobium cellulans]